MTVSKKPGPPVEPYANVYLVRKVIPTGEKMSMGASKVTSKGQVTIPIKIRRGKRLSTGRVVVFIETERGMMIVPLEEVERLFEPFDRRRRQLRLTRKQLAIIVRKEKDRTWKESYAQGAA